MSRRHDRLVELLQVDVFTTEPFAGNPAGVVLDGEGLSDAQMQKMAAEVNAGATAFLAPTTRSGADLRLRWFTPSGAELAFCGHGTLAAAHALAELGRLSEGRVVFETAGGLLRVSLATASGPRTVWLEPGVPLCLPETGPLASVLEALGVPGEGLATWARPTRTADRDLLVPVTGLEVLKSLAPDLTRLSRLATERNLRGFCLTTLEAVDPDSSAHSRFFAPHLGIPEDPVTGSVHASLAVWLWEAGLLRATGDILAFQAEQGDFLGRPGRLQVELHVVGGKPARVRVGGQAVTVLSGTIRLPSVP